VSPVQWQLLELAVIIVGGVFVAVALGLFAIAILMKRGKP
jgi:hypothetical protein